MPPATEPPPHFTALAVFACKKNRLYRVYVRPDELVFIWAGSGAEGVNAAHAVGAQHGLIGALAGVLIAKAFDPAKKNAARRAVLDDTPLDDLVGEHAKNLRAPVDEFEEVRVTPRSGWHAANYSDHAHQAMLRLKHRTLGKFRLGIASTADVEVAVRELPRVLGDVCRVEVEWSDKAKKFVKRAE